MRMRLKKVMEVSRVNYYFTGILIVLFVILAFMKPAYPGSTQTNTSGSNTAIEGGYTSTAVAILCQDERVFESMIQAGTPCPIDGKIGKEAKQLWGKYDHERPDYTTYVKRMEDRRKADEAEQKRITAELEEIDRLQAIEDKKLENAKKMKEWKHPR
jgi:hypothetical protein